MNTTGKTELINHLDYDVISLDRDYFPHPWTNLEWQGLNLCHHLLFSYKSHETLKGFALFGSLPGDDVAHLYKILIRPDSQEQGLATSFWVDIIEKLKAKGIARIYLEVEATNSRAIGFYQKVGFSLLREVKSYYSNGADGLMMELTL